MPVSDAAGKEIRECIERSGEGIVAKPPSVVRIGSGKRSLRAIEGERAGRIRIVKDIQARIAVPTSETDLVGAYRVGEGLIDVAGGVDASERRRQAG